MHSEAAAHHGSTSQRRKVASDHGAIGVLFLYTEPMEKQFAFQRLRQIVNAVDVAWIAPDGTVNVPAPGIRASVLVHLDAAKYLFEGAPKTLQGVLKEARRASPKGFPLPATFSLSRKSQHAIVSSPNVAAILPGSDPTLAHEIVLLTGHLDHVGVNPGLDGDKIHNGALDNSIGISMMLEVARALASAPSKPRRSVMFLAVTAEEKGLIGSDYFAHFPTVPLSRIIANVNLDGALPFYDFTDVIAFGAEHSTLGEIVAEAVAATGLKQSPDPFPEEGFFVRSDHYSFVKQGVPAMMLFMGMGKGTEGKSGEEVWHWFKREHLHRPSDDLNLPINYDVAAKFARVYQLITQRVADSPEAPRWYAGDDFGERFAPQAPKATRKSGASK
jgi:Zn-dependent M28 family amino/carboxypeptidase